MSPHWFLAWWNLVYIVPFMLALIYLGVYTTSGVTFGEADADADADADVGADGDVDADADADADAEAETDADHDADVDSDPPLLLSAASWLGLGRVPLSILLMVLLLLWGGIGFVVNFTLAGLLPHDGLSTLVSLPLAAWGSSHGTRAIVRLLARYLPTTETYARRRSNLVGAVGETLHGVDERFGLVLVRDRHGDLFQVACRVYREQPSVGKGRRVLLVDYCPQEQLFYVTPYVDPVLGGSRGAACDVPPGVRP